MACHQFDWLKNTQNFLRLKWEFQLLSNFRSIFLAFNNSHERLRFPTIKYECLPFDINVASELRIAFVCQIVWQQQNQQFRFFNK